MDSARVFKDSAQMVLDYWTAMGNDDRTKEPVCKLQSPEDLAGFFDKINMPISLQGDVPPCKDEETFLKAMQLTIDYSVHTAHPLYLGQLYGRADKFGSAAEVVSVALNTHTHTYESSPVFTQMEHAIVKKLCTIVGGRFAETPEGCFTPGGSTSNLFGMLCSRQKACPDLKRTGLFGSKPLQIFTSELCHYSAQKMGIASGLGTDNVVSIKSDPEGLMDMDDLKAKIEASKAAGCKPLMVMATSGTTVSGTFDPLDKIVDIATENGMWVHVDLCWGGGAAFSSTHRHLVKGLDRVDSCAFALHKNLSVPTQCALFITHHQGILREANAAGAAYLFQKSGPSLLDIGDKSIQ